MTKTVQEERWRSLKRWRQAYEKKCMDGLIFISTRPKTSLEEASIRVKEEFIALRKDGTLCAKTPRAPQLKKGGLTTPVRTIGKILKDERLVRKYRMKKVKYKYLCANRQPGELVEIDVKHVPGSIQGRKYYQYTAINTANRWRHFEVFGGECAYHSIEFLKIIMKEFPHQISAIKTDNHSTFTNYYLSTNKRSGMTVKEIHVLDRFCAEQGIIHYLIDPRKPAQNGSVERSHREDNKHLY